MTTLDVIGQTVVHGRLVVYVREDYDGKIVVGDEFVDADGYRWRLTGVAMQNPRSVDFGIIVAAMGSQRGFVAGPLTRK